MKNASEILLDMTRKQKAAQDLYYLYNTFEMPESYFVKRMCEIMGCEYIDVIEEENE